MLQLTQLYGFSAVAVAGAENLNITWNSSDKGTLATLSNGNLDLSQSGSGTWYAARATIGKTAGKFYWEVLIVAFSNLIAGAMNGSASVNNYVGATSAGAGHQGSGANLRTTWGTGTSPADTLGLNDVYNFAVDYSAGNMWVGKNGTWLSSGDPAAGTNPWTTGLSGTIYAAGSVLSSSDTLRLRTTNAQFTNSVPSGFVSYATI